MSNELLEIYLTDHCAAAAAGSRRMRRLADAERRSEDGSTLERVANEIDEDRTTLQSIMKAEGIEPRWYKSAMTRGRRSDRHTEDQRRAVSTDPR
jgi:reverse gyrase